MSRARLTALLVLGLLLLLALGSVIPRPAADDPSRDLQAHPTQRLAPLPVGRARTIEPTEGPPTAAPADTGPATDAVPAGRLRVPARTEHGPDDATWVIACGQPVRAQDPSGWVELVRAPGTCWVQGCRRTGGLQTCLPSESAQIQSGQVTVANPPLPAAPLAGLGVTLQAVAEGLLVVGLSPGAGADRAGLVDGDLLTEIDGTPTAGMSLSEFRLLGIGEAGTEAQLEVRHEDGSVEQLTLVRERLAP